MAATLFEDRFRAVAGTRAESAGVDAYSGVPASRPAVEAMARRGLSIAAHRARRVEEVALDRYDRILCMTESQVREISARVDPSVARRVQTLRAAVGAAGDVRDPHGEGADSYERCATEIEALVSRL